MSWKEVFKKWQTVIVITKQESVLQKQVDTYVNLVKEKISVKETNSLLALNLDKKQVGNVNSNQAIVTLHSKASYF
jgi:hypothetical protein